MVNVLDDILDESNDGSYEKEDDLLLPLLEEIDLIEDQSIMSFVRAVLLRVPDTFWESPSSIEGKTHPPDEHGLAGTIIHTKRVVRLVDCMAMAQERSSQERDILIAAALLHDTTRNIKLPDGVIMHDPFYMYTVDGFVEWIKADDKSRTTDANSSSLWLDNDTLAQILRIIRCHRGIWGPIPETVPLTTMDWTLHLADLIATKLHMIVDGEDVQMWRWNRDAES